MFIGHGLNNLFVRRKEFEDMNALIEWLNKHIVPIAAKIGFY
ncbi:hypothetical protein LAM01_15320 [Amylolactobacillus amylophilus]|nr:hypothetical protein LAM01_15320 [Amylolactobacillus amylophilus]